MKLIKTTPGTTDHNRCCVPCALSTVLNKPYEEVNNWLKYRGYRKGNNWGTHTSRMNLSELGLVKIPTDHISVNQFHLSHRSGMYFILVPGHGLALNNGIVFDTKNSEKQKVKEAYQRLHDKLPHDWDWAQEAFKKRAEREQQLLKQKQQEKIRKQKLREKKAQPKPKKTDQDKIDALLDRKANWQRKINRAESYISSINRKLKYYERKSKNTHNEN